jgi:DNA mismatch repair protein MutS2
MDNLFNFHDSPDHPILQQIGWTRLAKEVSAYAHFELNQHELQKPPKYRPKVVLESEYKLLAVYRSAIDEGEFQKYSVEQKKIINTTNFHDYLKVLTKKEVFNLLELNIYILFFEVALQSSTRIAKLFPKFEQHENDKKEFRKKLVQEFRTFVDYTGHADFLLHPVIGPLVKQLNNHEKKTAEVIQEHVRKLSEEGKLQFSGFDIINNKYVVPYRTDKYSSNLGSIIHRSDSGSTLYIELKAFEEHSLKRNCLKEAIEYEIFNLEKFYSQKLKSHFELIKLCIEVVSKNDYYFAKALWANTITGCIPEITNSQSIFLENFYHPSIENAVKNRFVIDDSQNVLLISGPNTGGKSIILKAICINYLLMYAALPLAAKAAKLYEYQDLFYIATDGQDLDKGLSSFAAEAQKIIRILNQISRKSLLIVDEIFNSTSSEEASVIAYAVMNYWNKNKLGHAIFTSHHQTLKSWVHENDSMSSAHVGFDSQTGAPTYVLHLGIPGSSHAIEIFKKLLTNSTIEKMLVDEIDHKKSKSVNYEDLIKNIQEKETNLIREVAIEKQECLKLKSELSAQIIEFESKKTSEYHKFKQQLDELKKKAQNVIPVVTQAPKKNINAHIENEFWKVSKEAELLIEKIPLEESLPKTKLISAVDLQIGKKYYSTQWKRVVEVISISSNNNFADVLMGNIKTRVKCSELYDSTGVEKQKFISSIERTTTANSTLDARGMRLEDFSRAAEQHLSFVISGDIPFLEIIHGHGDGVLKKWLWEYLKENDKLYRYEVPDLSYGGLTRVYLK